MTPVVGAAICRDVVFDPLSQLPEANVLASEVNWTCTLGLGTHYVLFNFQEKQEGHTVVEMHHASLYERFWEREI